MRNYQQHKTDRWHSRAAMAWALWLLSFSLLAVGAHAAEPLMVEKNLFSPERKHSEAKAEEPAPEPAKMQKGAIQLDGVVIRGDVKKAIVKVSPGLVKDQKNKQDPYVTVAENEQVGDYRVTKIEPRSITLDQRGSIFVVPLFTPGKAVLPPPRQSPVAPQAPGAGQPHSPPAARGAPPGQPQPGESVEPQQYATPQPQPTAPYPPGQGENAPVPVPNPDAGGSPNVPDDDLNEE
jgi:hypothetical protein